MQPYRSANGVLILILGILSLVGFSILTGIPAWILGNAGLRDINSGLADPSERGLVQAGRVLGIIGVVLACIGFCIWIFVIGAFSAMVGAVGLSSH